MVFGEFSPTIEFKEKSAYGFLNFPRLYIHQNEIGCQNFLKVFFSRGYNLPSTIFIFAAEAKTFLTLNA